MGFEINLVISVFLISLDIVSLVKDAESIIFTKFVKKALVKSLHADKDILKIVDTSECSEDASFLLVHLTMKQ